jgi:hypothetical protein
MHCERAPRFRSVEGGCSGGKRLPQSTGKTKAISFEPAKGPAILLVPSTLPGSATVPCKSLIIKADFFEIGRRRDMAVPHPQSRKDHHKCRGGATTARDAWGCRLGKIGHPDPPALLKAAGRWVVCSATKSLSWHRFK